MKTPGRSARGGFTLMEMIVTLSIFALLTAAVFGLFGATLQSVGTLQDDQTRADQAEALGGWLKKRFLALPANGTLLSYHREGVPFDVSDVIWGSSNRYSALDLHLEPNGHYLLRLANFEPGTGTSTAAQSAFARQVLNDDPSLNWRSLLRDVTAADWRFRIPNDVTWNDTAAGSRQAVVQFTFKLAGSDVASVIDCWLPPLAPPAGTLPLPPASVTANP